MTQPAFLQTLILQAVRRYVADAILSGSMTSASDCATEILKSYPACRLNHQALADEIALAAARAGVAVQIGLSADSKVAA